MSATRRDPIGGFVVPISLTAEQAVNLLQEIAERSHVFSLRQFGAARECVQELLRVWIQDLEHPEFSPAVVKLRIGFELPRQPLEPS